MAAKQPKVGVYGPKTRSLQSRLSYERVSQSWKFAQVYLYLGDRSEVNPSIDDNGITAFGEVPDRAYAATPIEINIEMDRMSEQSADLSRFGIIDPMGDEEIFRVHVESYKDLGRKIMVGDVFEIPFFEEDGKRAFWEIHDVDSTSEFENYYAVIKAGTLQDKREVEEIPYNNSNSDMFNDLQSDIDTQAEEDVAYNGVDTDGVTVEDPNTDTQDDYDPLDDNTGSFMDDPSKTF